MSDTSSSFSKAIIALVIVLGLAAALMTLKYTAGSPASGSRSCISKEGFSTVAVDRDLMPRCFTRDADAQAILLALRETKATNPDAFGELNLILQKMLCVDADVTGAGVGGYQSFQLPFVTQHDLEPAASFVGRCLKGAVRSRDLELTFDKWEKRGAVLIQTLAAANEAVRSECQTRFHSVAKRAARNIGQAWTNQRVSMDIPAGPRDPGYTVPSGLEQQGAYSIRGNVQYI